MELDDQIGRMILDDLNGIAQQVNGAYDQVNTRNATVEQIRSRLSLMRHGIDMIESHLISNTVLKSV